MFDETPHVPTIEVDLARISTPRERCLMLTTGPIDAEVIRQAESERFDQLPVLDEQGALVGLVAVKHARALLDGGLPLDASDPSIDLREIKRRASILALLDELSRHRALIYRDKQHQSEQHQGKDWFALVTISDLNRHHFRAHLYPILAELEALLAELIDCRFEDPWDWLPCTSEEAQVRLVGQWELEKRRNVDTSPITGATLTDMLRVIARADDLRAAFGFTSAGKFRDYVGSVPDLRNQIMHPVRPLVLGQEDVGKLHSRLELVLRLTQDAKTLTKRLSARGLASRRVFP